MKLRVILRGSVIITAVWVMVFAAQGYFRSLRLTADTVEGVVEEAGIVDWSTREGEPSGAVAQRREEKIREVAELLSKLDFAESDRARQKNVAARFFDKLSSSEKSIFVQLAVRSKLELYMTAFDALEAEKREGFLKKTRKELEYERNNGEGKEEMEALVALLDQHAPSLVKNGVRATVDEMSTEEMMEFAQAMQIMNELMQRVRMPNWEGRGDE